MVSKLEQLETGYKQFEQEIIELADRIWEIPETRFKEFESAKILTTYFRKLGFEVETGIGGIETAFVAKYGNEGPVIGILGEYDALPGLSQKAGSDVREALVSG